MTIMLENNVRRFFGFRAAALILFCIFAAFLYLFLTPVGSTLLLRQYLLVSKKVGSIEVARAKGSLFRVLEWEGVTVTDVRWLGMSHRASCGKVFIKRLGMIDYQIAISEGEIDILNSATILVDGNYRTGHFEGRIRSGSIDYKMVERFLSIEHDWAILDGKILDLDIRFQGNRQGVEVTGDIGLDDFSYHAWLLDHARLYLEVFLERDPGTDSFNIGGNIRASDVVLIPDVSFIHRIAIKELDFSRGKEKSDWDLKVNFAKIMFQDDSFVLVHGHYEEAALRFNVFSRWINIQETIRLTGLGGHWRNLNGTMTDIDIDVKGGWDRLEIDGVLGIERLVHENIELKDVPANIQGQFDLKKARLLNGTAKILGGTVQGPKTAVITLEESRISLNDNLKVALTLNGQSVVGRKKIDIAVRGTADKPEIVLNSRPPLPQEQLLVMVMTNKSWTGTEKSLSEGRISADLAKDLIDYFFLADKGGKIAQRLGISDFAVTVEKDRRGFGVTKSLISTLDTTYAVEQLRTPEGNNLLTQKLGGEFKVTENVSVGAEREVTEDRTFLKPLRFPPKDKVTVKFKTDF